MPLFDDIPDDDATQAVSAGAAPSAPSAPSAPAPLPQPADDAGTHALNWLMEGTSDRTDPTQIGRPSYYDDLPELERNQDPKSRTIGVLAHQASLGALPYIRAGVEAQKRGESFWGGSERYERERKAVQEYYNAAYENASDPIKVLGGIGLPGGPMAQAGKYLTTASRPILTAGALGVAQAGVAGYLAPIEPNTQDWRERVMSAVENMPIGAVLGGAAGSAGHLGQMFHPSVSTPEQLAAFHRQLEETAHVNPFGENARAAEAIQNRDRLIEDQSGKPPTEETASAPPEQPSPAGSLFADIPDEVPAGGEAEAPTNRPDAFSDWMENHVPDEVKNEIGGQSFAVTDPRQVAAQQRIQAIVQADIAAGRTHTVNPRFVAETHSVINTYANETPAEIPVATITSAKPFQYKGDAWVRLDFAAPDGRQIAYDMLRADLLATRAAWLPDDRAITLFDFGDAIGADPKRGIETLGGRIRHELVHGLRDTGLFTTAEWGSLVGHADALRVMDQSGRDFFRLVGVPNWQQTIQGKSLREFYHEVYADRNPDELKELMDQEAVAHMAEIYHHAIMRPAGDPFRQGIERAFADAIPELQKMFSGEIARRRPEDLARAAYEPSFAAAAEDRNTGQSMPRDLDALGYYSAALEAAKGLKQAKGVARKILRKYTE